MPLALEIIDILNEERPGFWWNGRALFATTHGKERRTERGRSWLQIKSLYKRVLQKYSQMSVRAGEEILFYSRSLNQGIVTAVEGKNLRIITFLPPGRNNPMPGTTMAFVENFVEVD